MKITKAFIYSAILTSVTMILSFVPLKAQKATSMRINEVLVKNENNFIDQYGNHSSWIEFFNTSSGTVDIRGCYLTNDPKNLTKYRIPKGDVQTLIPPKQHIVFFADGNKDRGTFHLNFELSTGSENFIALVDADGKTIIDSVTIPADMGADKSYARQVDGAKDWILSEKVTPSTNNVTLDSNEKIDRLKERDPSGGIMTITAISVVFLGLLLMSYFFKLIGSFSNRPSKKSKVKAHTTASSTTPQTGEIPEEVQVAIALALYEETENVHDPESYVLTFANNRNTHSGWSSKSQIMRPSPQYKAGY
ncbi:Uncharacterised protein [Porphyromonas macacae]|uniref:LTD domain-containing protein n=1 Tax=Porphyromonas macacae TaxID=28115 RepID=A0A379E945_9PORP|nr:OadG family transporter subunit [Porphyromonas macacae]SUB89208.1 Uncharacterised protein [Porphyromonas macacae]